MFQNVYVFEFNVLQDFYVVKIIWHIPVWSFHFISLEKKKTEFTCDIKAAIVSTQKKKIKSVLLLTQMRTVVLCYVVPTSC